MFSSRTLTDRNNDPEPWEILTDPAFPRVRAGKRWLAEFSNYAPRPAYQFGTLPENPILVAVRQWLNDGTVTSYGSALWKINNGGIAATHYEFAHAHRVLSLLAAVTR